MLAVVLAAVLLLLTKAVTAQQQPHPTATSAIADGITIYGLACPTNTVTLNSTVADLSAYATPDTTYLLEPGVYQLTSPITVDDGYSL